MLRQIVMGMSEENKGFSIRKNGKRSRRKDIGWDELIMKG